MSSKMRTFSHLQLNLKLCGDWHLLKDAGLSLKY